MKKIRVLLVLVTMFDLYFSVIYPWNLGERSLILNLKERHFGDEYAELRTGYFISLNKKQLWYDYDTFYIGADHDVFRVTKVYLQMNKKIAKDCKVTTSGMIEWHKPDLHMDIYANVLSNEPLVVRVGADKYLLDETERSIFKYESETGMDAYELLETVHLIRKEYKAALSKMSEAEYQANCDKIQKAIWRLIVRWIIFILVCIIIKISKKLYEMHEKRIDEDMEDYIK